MFPSIIDLRPDRMSVTESETVKKMVDELLKFSLISESTSPYSFPIVLVGKKDEGPRTRLCIDFRKLNDVTITESYPFPLIDDLIDKVHNCNYFSTLDIASGFHHIQIRTSDKHKTEKSWLDPDIQYEYGRLKPGLSILLHV